MGRRIIISASIVGLFLVLAAAPALAVPAVPKIDSLAMSVTQPAVTSSSTIWYDNFDIDRAQAYFETTNNYSATTAFGNSGMSMTCYYPVHQNGSDIRHLAFGDCPITSNRRRSGEKFTDVYWRVYVKYPSNWVGGTADKLSRCSQFAASSWAQAGILHVWGGSGNSESLDPATGIKNNLLVSTGWNDFPHLTWLGLVSGQFQIAAPSEIGRWVCVECRMKLNSTSSTTDGYSAMWVDGKLDAEKKNLNYRGTWNTYGINAVFLETYWNATSTVNEYRYLDDFVISTQPIGPVTVPANPTLFKTSWTTTTCTGWEVMIASDSLGADVVWSSTTLPGANNTLVVNTSTGAFSGSAAGLDSLPSGPMYFSKVRQQDSAGWSAWSYWHQPFMVYGPMAANDSYQAFLGYTLTVGAPGVLSNDNANGTGTLTAVKITNPLHGTLTLNSDGSFTYTPAAGYSGTDSFTYKAHTSAGDSSAATVTIAVTTTVPTAVNDSYTAYTNQTMTVPAASGVLANDIGPAGLTITAIKVTNPSHGSVTLNSDGSFVYTPTTGYSGSDSFIYKAHNSNGDGNTATVNITVTTGVSITVISPNGGEVWAAGSSSYAVAWSSIGSVGNVDIELSTNDGETWTTLVANTENVGYRSVTLPDIYSKTCLVRVKQTAGGSPTDASDDDFTITLAGDATGNGYVDGSDLNMLLANWNVYGATWAMGDFTGNGYVDGDDLNLLLSRWNMQAPPAGAGSNQSAADTATTGAIGSSSNAGTTDTTTVATTDMSSSASIANARTIVPAKTAAPAFTAQINFQPASVVAPEGYLIDSGLPFGTASNGYSYGWTTDLSRYAVCRNNAASPDVRYDTAIVLASGGTWEMAVPNGMYDMKIVAGAGGTQAAQNFSVEGVPTRQTQAQTTAVTGWSEESITVVVTDGRLTITASPGSSICFVQITGH